MSRAGRPQLRSTQLPGGTELTVMTPPGLWILTYQGAYVTARRSSWTQDAIKYQRSTWNKRATAEAQAKKYNQWFDTTAFDIQRIL